jgi:tRNA (guanine10-N2)-dimethyltransferase
MRLLIELSGEAPEIARAEVRAICSTEGNVFSELENDGRVMDIETDADPKVVAGRLALAWSISAFHVSCALADAPSKVQEIELPGKTFRVTVRRLGTNYTAKESADIAGKIGEVLSRKYKVELENPEVDVRVLLSNRCHIGLLYREIDRSLFESRKSENRPFTHPISLHPKLARALVNLTGVLDNQTILDPFCGTGGILLEAGLMGMGVIGSDIDERMISGSQQNLRHFGVEGAELRLCDVSEIPTDFKQVDAIVTDPPYGRSASTNKESVESYERSFDSFSNILKPGGKVAIVLPSEEHVNIGLKNFSLCEKHPVRVHRSLTRYFCVFEKSNEN